MDIGNGSYVVKLNEKSYVKGEGYIPSVNLYRHPFYASHEIVTDISKATVFLWKEQAQEVVNEYGGKILELTTKEV